MKFLLDDELIEDIDTIKMKKNNFLVQYDMKSKDFECVSCELYMNDDLLARGVTSNCED